MWFGAMTNSNDQWRVIPLRWTSNPIKIKEVYFTGEINKIYDNDWIEVQ